MDYNRPVDHVVGQIRHICGPKIPFAVCRRLASNIIPEFPNLCDHDDDGVVIGEGTGGLGKKLKNRNSYLNRSQVAEQLDIIRKLGNDKKKAVPSRSKKKSTSLPDIRTLPEQIYACSQIMNYPLMFSMNLNSISDTKWIARISKHW